MAPWYRETSGKAIRGWVGFFLCISDRLQKNKPHPLGLFASFLNNARILARLQLRVMAFLQLACCKVVTYKYFTHKKCIFYFKVNDRKS